LDDLSGEAFNFVFCEFRVAAVHVFEQLKNGPEVRAGARGMLSCLGESVGAQQQEQTSRPAGAMGRGQQQAVLWSTVMSQIVTSNPDQDNPELS